MALDTFFPEIIKEFRHRFQDVQVSLVEMAPGMQHQALQTGAIDIGFTRALQPADAAFLRSEHFLTEPMYAVCSRAIHWQRNAIF